ncbi:hypothetical protein RD792_010725 [Penstemon davidsonii]|uniref:RING-type E3 ubiquitin transferase n=1 Tax=Penstemon davidsonii TaxID=160366 RepID=A0ABR0D2R0_9LAMI|nr:hypothetical protein RD792_010725 [Penstemon davidsonii]
MAVSYENYTFLSCPRAQVSFTTGRIDCLSNSTTIILATKYPTEVLQLPMCKEIVTLPVPVSTSYQRFPDYFELTLNVSTCASCTSTSVQAIKDCRTSYCGNMNGLAIDAPFSLEGGGYNIPVGGGNNIPGGGENNIDFARVIALALGIPALVMISICICVHKSREDNHQANNSIQTSGGVALSNIVTAELNGSTIATYETIKIGESRLEGPNYATCTICLEDYLPMDTAASYQNYTLLSCPRDQVSFTTHAIDCLSNSTTKILAIKNPREVIRWSMCKEINTLSIPVSSFYDYGLDYGFPLSLDLTWNDSTCTSCSSATGQGILNDDNTD